ncbi:Enamine deaminase RidA, house cleaning of reactive enamine intermediates, YjgF/YER057c/UK114 family [Alteromonadaceae bacterium Bs31]|nr:Enamine deaminase RidA, house cleaning of reactive enamine intermediates, YjgF/YER057c/UK114 family [Alteromonadaceae bacterium Bs31]
MTFKQISSGSEFEALIGYSRAIVDGDYVFVSGTTGFNYSNMTISDNVAEQAEQCFINIENALKQADSAISHIVRITYILPDRRDFEACWPVLRKWLGEVKPAATMFEARLLQDEMKVEIQATARIKR